MIKIILGVFLGVGLVVAVTNSPHVAPLYSQAIYDCGVRISNGVNMKIEGAHISGHKKGICIDGSFSGSISNNTVVIP